MDCKAKIAKKLRRRSIQQRSSSTTQIPNLMFQDVVSQIIHKVL
jgi:hypothetical protein